MAHWTFDTVQFKLKAYRDRKAALEAAIADAQAKILRLDVAVAELERQAEILRES